MSVGEYDDDRPGMMRVHIAQARATALEETFTRDALRLAARQRGVFTGGRKSDLALRLVWAGFNPFGTLTAVGR